MTRIGLRRALVIGSEGNVGGPLARYLAATGYEVMEADIRPALRDDYLMADMNHPVDLLPAFDWRPDVVFLLAATVGRMTCEQAGSLAIATNLAGINNVLQLCKRCRQHVRVLLHLRGIRPRLRVDGRAAPRRGPTTATGCRSGWANSSSSTKPEPRHFVPSPSDPACSTMRRRTIGEHRSAMIRFASNLARGRPSKCTGEAPAAGSTFPTPCAPSRRPGVGAPRRHQPRPSGYRPGERPGGDDPRGAPGRPRLVIATDLPRQMTLVKRPTLDRQRTLLEFEPAVSLSEGVRRVCAYQMRLVAAERARQPGIPVAHLRTEPLADRVQLPREPRKWSVTEPT